MKHLTINGQVRQTGRKADVKSIRREGKVPCILYGQGVENISFAVDAKEFMNITHTPASYIIDLVIDGKQYLAVFHDVQYHPLTDEAIHADFLAVSADKPIVIDVPLHIVGHAEGVKQGGKLVISARKLRVCGLMENLPDDLTIDITDLKLGKQISAGDLSFENIQIVTHKTALICAIKATRNSAAAAKE